MNDLLKTQMLLQVGKVNNPLLNLITLNMFEIGVRTFPQWYNILTNLSCCRRRKQTNSLNINVPPILKSIRASIVFEKASMTSQSSNRNAQQTGTLYSNRMDAVIHYVTTLPSMRNLLSVINYDYLPNEFDAIGIDTDVFFELQELKMSSDGNLEIIKFKLFCYDHDVQHLQNFVDTCNTDYERRMANKLGTSKYFFDQMVSVKTKASTQNPLPTSHLLYTKSKFTTNRTFKNVFFEEREHVEGRTSFFLERRDWYDKKGIPYTLGFMFHGTPGTGKTSTVKAIANEARRHIINVQLSEIKTKQQLQHLFFNDEIHVFNGISTEKYTIPVNERLYVIEDIDAMGDTVLRREWKKPATSQEPEQKSGDIFTDRMNEKKDEKETIDLSFLLNLLDGTLESNGRILIITTNFPERIDKALIRPGRIDMIVKFKKCNREVMHEMMESFYDKQIDLPTDETLDYKWSPAEVNQILFRNFTEPMKALEELISLKPQDLYGFEENGINDIKPE